MSRSISAGRSDEEVEESYLSQSSSSSCALSLTTCSLARIIFSLLCYPAPHGSRLVSIMGQAIVRLELHLLLGKDQATPPGFLFLLPLRCWEKGSRCQMESEEKALV